jgi:putative peptide zinc metalloprotease protein
MSRPIFSPSWHNVADLRPRLVAGARMQRHVYRGQTWYVVQDRAGRRNHRLNAAAYAFVARMDGETPVQVLWERLGREMPPDAIPTQVEVVDLLMQLHAADLLHVDVTPDAATLFTRYRKRRSQPWKQWLLNPVALKLPLLDPDAFLARWSPRVAWLFSRRGFLLWLCVVPPALVLAIRHGAELTDNLQDRVLSASNLLLLALVFPLIKALHELGHGFATKAWGGSVHEMGVMLLAFAPAPYVDASAASAFPSKERRAVVGAAGMLVETFVAALALYVWLAVEPGLVRALAFNVMVIAGVSTLIVNGNPLLRYDGYYILCDLIEMPNLAQRAQRYLAYLADRYLFGARDAEVPAESSAEKRWLVFYGIASWCYRVFVSISIILFVAGEFFIFGTLIAIWASFSLLGLPLWKAIQHLRNSPSLQHRRRHAKRVALGLAIGVAAFLFVVPLPLRTQAEGVVWLPEQAIVRAGANGFFQRWLVEPSAAVRTGLPVLAMEDPLLAAELEVARAKAAEARAKYTVEQFSNPAKAEVLRKQLEHAENALAHVEEKYARLVVVAGIDGTLIVPTPQDMPGQFFKKGDLLGYVLDRQHYIARVVVPQDNVDLVRSRLRSVQLRLADSLYRVHAAKVLREVPGGTDELPSAALGSTGGGPIATDPRDSRGVKTIDRVFVFDIQLPAEVSPSAFGEHVHVRFDHASEPLAQQIYRRVRQLFLTRLHA